MRQFRPYHFPIFITVVSIYIAARLWRLTDSCLWFDEIFSSHAAEHSWNELFSFVALDLIHPPLFYVLLKIWIAIGGEGVLWLRLFPVLFSVVAVVPFILLCRELKIRFWSMTLALFLLAVNGSLIKYSQEVRMYSLLMCLSLFSIWLFVRFFNRGNGLIALTAVNLLMVCTHYFGWLVIASEIVVVASLQRKYFLRTLSMTAIVLAGFLPWAVVVWQTAAGSSLGQNIGWMTRPDLREIGQFLLHLVEPFYYQPSSADATSDYRVSVPILIIVLAAFAVYIKNLEKKPAEEKGTFQIIALLALTPVVVVFAASWLLPYSVWGTRHLIIVFPLAWIFAGLAVSSMNVHWLKTAGVTLLLLFSGYAFVMAIRRPQIFSWCNWGPQAVRAVETHPAGIYVLEDLAAYHVWFALRQPGQTTPVAKIKDVPGVAEDTAYFLPRGFDEIGRIGLADVREKRFWLGYRADSFDDTKEPLKTFIDMGYRIVVRDVLDAAHEQTIFVLLEKGS